VQTENEIREYIDRTTALNTFFRHPPLNVKEIGDGNLNFIFRISEPKWYFADSQIRSALSSAFGQGFSTASKPHLRRDAHAWLL